MKILFLFAALSVLPLSGSEKPQKYVIRAEDGLTELVKEELQEVRQRSNASFTLCREKSDHEILVISPEK